MAEELKRFSFHSRRHQQHIRSSRELAAEQSVVAISKENVLEKLKSLKVAKSPGQDPRVLKQVAEEIVEVLVLIFQESLEEAEFFVETMSKSDKGEPVDMTYLDFQRTFDKVLHSTLPNKMNPCYGQATGMYKGLAYWQHAENREKDFFFQDCSCGCIIIIEHLYSFEFIIIIEHLYSFELHAQIRI
eukprot:g39966.t1